MSRYAKQTHSLVEQLEPRMHLSAANDPFSGRTVIDAFPATITDTNVGSSAEVGEPAHAGLPAERSVWYTWTSPISGTIHISTGGSNFDTVLAVYTGNTLATLQPVAADDDSGAAAGYSIVTFNASAGTTYQIAVDGFQGATGSITLSITNAQPLVIDGTAGDDDISVASDGTNYIVTINGTPTSYAISSVLSLTINGGDGNDRIAIEPNVLAAALSGGAGNDTLIGSDGPDLLRGDDGDDEIFGGFGGDTIYGNDGNDTIYGESGDDSIMAGLGNDSVDAGAGDDSIYTGNGPDTILAGDGNDYIEGRGKADLISGGAGNDTIWGGAGADTISGDAGDDVIYARDTFFIDSVDGGDGTDSATVDPNDLIINNEKLLA